MRGVIVECIEHGFMEVGVVSHGAGADVVITRSRAQCPICGRLSPILDGRYRETAEGVLEARVHLTPQQEDRLRAALIWARQHRNKDDAPEDVAKHLEQQLEAAVPQARRFLDAVTGKTAMAATTYVSVLIALIMMFVTFGQSRGFSEQDVEKIVHDAVKSVQEEQERTGLVEPTPPTPAPQSPRSGSGPSSPTSR